MVGTFILVSNEIRELEFEKGEKEEMEMLKTFSRSDSKKLMGANT